jgi:Spy/CpxP family protein refolding chaperone
MHTLRKALLGLAVLVVCTALARPAEDDEAIIAREDAIEVMLLRQKSVQEDLKLSPEHGQKIHEFADSQWKKVRAMKELSKEERDRRFEAMAKDNERFLKDTLSEPQRKRLNQIAMHVAGLLWIMRSDIAKELNLTEEQKRKIHELHREAHKEAQEAIRSAGGPEVKEEKFHEMRTANRKRLMSVLTDEQKAKWKEMAGPPFRGELHFGPRAEK